MSDSIIPVDMDEIPTRRAACDESLIYTVIVRDVEIADKRDKNGNAYARADFEVTEPEEWRGNRLTDSYIGIPMGHAELKKTLGREPREFEIRKARERGDKLARFVKAFRVSYTKNQIDLRDAIGREGKVSIENQEYPEGSGEISSRVKDYIA